jgi:hypothetical protein
MKNEKAVFEFGKEYRCVQFTDVDPDVSGVEIFIDNKRLGSIIDLDIPDIEDEEENEKFDNEVIDWIVENS